MSLNCPLNKEYRCNNCKKLFFKGVVIEGQIEVKCKKCKEMNIINCQDSEKYICLKEGCPNRVHYSD